MNFVRVTLSDNHDHFLEAQFNPETLVIEHQTHGEEPRKVAGDESSPGIDDKAGMAGARTASSTVSQVMLLFDTSDTGDNVRNKTLELVAMMTPKDGTMPVVTFQYGSLMFTVNITGFTEELTYFSDQGVPLRAKVNLRMTEAPTERASNNVGSQNSGLGAAASASLGASFSASAGGSVEASVSAGLSTGATIGTTPLDSSQGGESLQSMAGRSGANWKTVAEANNIENPRRLPAGTLLNLNVD